VDEAIRRTHGSPLRPILNLRRRQAREVADVSRYERSPVGEGDGRDAEVQRIGHFVRQPPSTLEIRATWGSDESK
jgi:hypothetical protein